MNDSITACQAGRDFLLRELGNHVSPDAAETILSHYLDVADTADTPRPIEAIYFRMLVSAQNANMKANIIGGSIGGIENFGKVTFGFDPSRVLEEFGEDYLKLFAHARATLKPNGRLRSDTRSIWPSYCRTALAAALFLAQFKDGADFFEWANRFYRDPRSMPVLPLLVSQEVFGMGYPLACDFLKDLGFTGYGKPDIHIKRILLALGFVEGGVSDYGAQKAIAHIAADSGMSSYSVDKLFWLIGSGKFYDHPELGKKGKIGQNYKQFLNETAPRMSWWNGQPSA
jgi:hypothetical protein